jgi:hypothetical protein
MTELPAGGPSDTIWHDYVWSGTKGRSSMIQHAQGGDHVVLAIRLADQTLKVEGDGAL